MDNTHHVSPIRDTIPHTKSIHCICVPKIQWHGKGMVIFHQSWDKRELVEYYAEGLHYLVNEKV